MESSLNIGQSDCLEEHTLDELKNHPEHLLQMVHEKSMVFNGVSGKPLAVMIDPEEYLFLLSLKQSQLKISYQYGFDMIEGQQIIEAKQKIDQLNNLLFSQEKNN